MDAFEKVQRDISGAVAAKKVAGACAAISYKGKNLFEYCCGFANLEKHTKIAPDSVFRLASMTKPVTAAAVLLCREKGLLDLTDKVSKFIPVYDDLFLAEKKGDGFVRGARCKQAVTVLHLLTHSSGIGSGAAGDWQFPHVKPRPRDTLADAVERYAGTWLDFEPGTEQFYSPVLGLDIAARIVEIVSGTPYADFIAENLLCPLEMTETSYFFSDISAGKRVISYTDNNGELVPDQDPEHNFDMFPQDYPGGGAGLMSSLRDYMHFAEMLAAKGEFRGKKILERSSVELMRKPWLPQSIEGITDWFNWGLGVRTLSKSFAGQPLPAGSFGWSGAYGTHFWADPDHEVAAVYMHNSLTYGGAGAPHTAIFEKNVTEALKQLGIL